MSDPQTSSMVDVLVPVRAPAPWLPETLQSVLHQTIKDWRLLVIMDGFSEDVRDACDSLPTGTPLRLEVLPPRSGLVSVLNHGLRASSARFVARLDADDICHPQRLAQQVSYMSHHPECVALGTGVELIDENGSPRGIRTRREAGPVLRTLRWRSPIAHPSVMMRRKDAIDVGAYSARALHAEDFDLWLRMAGRGEIHTIPDVLLRYRIHSGQITANVTFPLETLQTIGESRAMLARKREESLWAAQMRQWAWVKVNRLKGRV